MQMPFLNMKMRLFIYPPYVCGHSHQNKLSILSGCAAETGDAAWYPCNFWGLVYFSSGQCTSP